MACVAERLAHDADAPLRAGEQLVGQVLELQGDDRVVRHRMRALRFALRRLRVDRVLTVITRRPAIPPALSPDTTSQTCP